MSKPTATVRGLVSSGITHVVGIPDNTSGPLFDAVARHPTLQLVTVTREGAPVHRGSCAVKYGPKYHPNGEECDGDRFCRTGECTMTLGEQ